MNVRLSFRLPESRKDGVYPFDASDLHRDQDGRTQYLGLPPTLTHMLKNATDREPEEDALVSGDGRVWSYADLWERVLRISGGLKAAGIGPGHRVVLCAGNSIEWIAVYMGVVTAGATVVPVNHKLSKPELEYLIEDADASLVITDPVAAAPDGDPFWNTETGPDDIASICYSSGTTGRPKGAMASHGNLVSGLEGWSRGLAASGGRAGFRMLIATPLFHAAGLLTQLLYAFRMRGAAVVLERFEPVSFLAAAEEHRVNCLFGVPAIWYALIEHPAFAKADLSAVETLMYGAAPIPPELVKRLRVEFPQAQLCNGYGTTETGNLTALPDRDADAYPESVGFPTPATEFHIPEPDDQGVGELLVRGPQVMQGYWNMPEATAEALVDGWYRTGDICRLDEDGRLEILDRSKDMVIRGGENVYSLEVENALQAVPGVVESAVIGVPDEVLGERVAVRIRLGDGVHLGPQDILAELRKGLAAFKLPELILIDDEPIPRNTSGKLIKAELRRDSRWSELPITRLEKKD